MALEGRRGEKRELGGDRDMKSDLASFLECTAIRRWNLINTNMKSEI